MGLNVQADQIKESKYEMCALKQVFVKLIFILFRLIVQKIYFFPLMHFPIQLRQNELRGTKEQTNTDKRKKTGCSKRRTKSGGSKCFLNFSLILRDPDIL